MVQIDHSQCIQCGLCAENCAAHALKQNNDGQYICSRLLCFQCGQCVAICPEGAVSMENAETPLPYQSETFDLDPNTLLNAMRFRRSIAASPAKKSPVRSWRPF